MKALPSCKCLYIKIDFCVFPHVFKVFKRRHGAYMTAKAWNGRVIAQWLSDCSDDAYSISHPPADSQRFHIYKYKSIYYMLLKHIMLLYAILCYIMFYYVLLYNLILYHIVLYYIVPYLKKNML